jgi:hypothetical protein
MTLPATCFTPKRGRQDAQWLRGEPLLADEDHMDPMMIAEHLSQTEQHVVDAERHIARQRELVAELSRDGHDTRLANDLLLRFEDLQRLHVADQNRLRDELAKCDA